MTLHCLDTCFVLIKENCHKAFLIGVIISVVQLILTESIVYPFLINFNPLKRFNNTQPPFEVFYSEAHPNVRRHFKWREKSSRAAICFVRKHSFAQGLMRASVVVIFHEVANTITHLCNVVSWIEVYVLLLDCSPEPLYPYVVFTASSTIHADSYTVTF